VGEFLVLNAQLPRLKWLLGNGVMQPESIPSSCIYYVFPVFSGQGKTNASIIVLFAIIQAKIRMTLIQGAAEDK